MSRIHTDQLGSVVKTTGVAGNKKYTPYGGQRSSTTPLPTDRTYTGQEDDGSYLLYYGARYYDPRTGQFMSPDTIVPNPDNVFDYNRYMYGYGNPVKYSDPSGHQSCSTDWCWKDRWYKAHGYFVGSNGHWSIVGDPSFADEGILNDTLAEAGVSWEAEAGLSWSFEAKKSIATGVVKLAHRMNGGAILGLSHLGSLVGKGAIMRLQQASPAVCEGTRPCVPEFWRDPNIVYWPLGYVQQQSSFRLGVTAVHELAHVIDFASGSVPFGTLSAGWDKQAAITAYGECTNCVRPWEKWAEAVTTWVYGSNYPNMWAIGGPASNPLTPSELRAQMNLITDLINQ